MNYLATKLIERHLFLSRYDMYIAIPVAPFTPWQEKVTKENYYPSLNKLQAMYKNSPEYSPFIRSSHTHNLGLQITVNSLAMDLLLTYTYESSYNFI